MTEEEARQKWCPMAREYIVNNDPDRHTNMFDDRNECLASECMAWRWTVKHQDIASHGYCGLAGKP